MEQQVELILMSFVFERLEISIYNVIKIFGSDKIINGIEEWIKILTRVQVKESVRNWINLGAI